MTDWRKAAACRGQDPDLFHAGERDTLATEQARAICHGCPSRVPCLTNAYNQDDQWGIFAGQTPRQRKAALRRADGNVARAVADALHDSTELIRNVYGHHAQPGPDGHVLWTDPRHQISVRGTVYTPHQVAFQTHHGRPPIGHVQRACEVEGCVAKACLSDRPMRNRAMAAAKATA